LDHFLIGAADLEGAAEWFARLSGTTPIFGGIHPNQGTANYLVSLGNGCYLELIGSIPGEKPRALGQAFSEFQAPRLFWFAIATNTLSAHSVALKNLGMDIAGPFAGSRASSDGSELTWRIIEFGQHGFGGCLPFMIDWETTPHPSTGLRPAVSLNSFEITHPRADDLRKIYRSLGLELNIREGASQLELTLDTPKGSMLLAGTAYMPWFQSFRHSVFNRK